MSYDSVFIYYNRLFRKLYVYFKNLERNIILNFTESHNHRMLGVGRDLERSSSWIPLLEQEHLGQVTQERVQAGFEYLQRWRLHNPPWAACSTVLSLSLWKSFVSYLSGTSYVPGFIHCPLSLPIGCHRVEPGSVLLTHILYIFLNINKVTPQSLIQAKQIQLP